MILKRIRTNKTANSTLKDGYHSVWISSIAETRYNGQNALCITFKNRFGFAAATLPINSGTHETICKLGILLGGYEGQDFKLHELINLHLDIEVIYGRAKYFDLFGSLVSPVENLL